MMTVHPPEASITLTSIAKAKGIYRGMSRERLSFAPSNPLFSSIEDWKNWVRDLQHTASDQLVYEHVLKDVLAKKQEKQEKQPDRAVSFTFSSYVARAYALSNGSQLYSKKEGFVGLFPLPPVEEIHLLGGVPFLYFCADNTVWLDPRYWQPETSLHAIGFNSFEYARDCARTDNEIILVFGEFRASRLMKVTRCPPQNARHSPWQNTIAALRSSALQPMLPHASSFEEMCHQRDEMRKRAVLASFLGG